MRTLFTFIFFISCQLAIAKDVDSLFIEANVAYQKEQYVDAIEIYDSILQSDFHSFETYYNLGNSYYFHGNMSKSILFYEKAIKLNPHHVNCQENLKIAQNRITKIEDIPVLFLQKWWNQISQSMSLSFWFSILIILIWINCLIVYLFVKNRKKYTFNSLIISLLLTLFTATIYRHSNKESLREFAIVMIDSEIFSSETSKKPLFDVKSGNKVEILTISGDWFIIRLSDGRTGYIKSLSLKSI
jgi:tetratricopeptide (TPR) repeat protein